MKTAMQEWFDELKANYPYMANEIYQKGFQKYLEKEKEQIIDAYYGKINGVFGYREEGQEYYNQTYNQQEDKTFKQKSKWTEVDNMTRRLK
jgi:hypothetical protein